MRTPKNLAAVTASILALAPLTASAIGLQVMVNGQAVVFDDVSQSAWYTTYISQAATLGIVSGYEDANGKPLGEFRPSGNITIAEALKISSEGAGYNEGMYSTAVASGVNHWSSSYVSVANAEKFVLIDPRTKLDNTATRAEVAALITSAFHVDTSKTFVSTTYKDVNLNTKFAAEIETLSKDEVVTGDTNNDGTGLGTFRPTDKINRAEVTKMIMRAREVYGTPGKDRVPGGSSSSASSTQTSLNVVTYGSTGFSPSVLRVKKGTMVTFKNESSTNMWVASDPHPTHTGLPGLDSLEGKIQGQNFAYTFNQIGTFSYHNHLNVSHTATIIVEE